MSNSIEHKARITLFLLLFILAPLGINSAASAQVRVLELEVVTGEGHLVDCSRRHRLEQVSAVLASLGQLRVFHQRC